MPHLFNSGSLAIGKCSIDLMTLFQRKPCEMYPLLRDIISLQPGRGQFL